MMKKYLQKKTPKATLEKRLGFSKPIESFNFDDNVFEVNYIDDARKRPKNVYTITYYSVISEVEHQNVIETLEDILQRKVPLIKHEIITTQKRKLKLHGRLKVVRTQKDLRYKFSPPHLVSRMSSMPLTISTFKITATTLDEIEEIVRKIKEHLNGDNGNGNG